ncbi:NADPH dehydrogenase [mine drainage metagenome]|uniref:NADPH dehydrogenase n=1 Tax=mine drainage metagenome TaxID=410659 RepID=A0A1J5PF35_9ZZZZ
MSAMPIGAPGWPELAACTASIARARMALAMSLRLARPVGIAAVCPGAWVSSAMNAPKRYKTGLSGDFTGMGCQRFVAGPMPALAWIMGYALSPFVSSFRVAMSLLFSPLHLPSPRGGLLLSNRIVVAPMCQYQASQGCATDWHLMHWGNLLNSGAALLTLEATAVLPEGRITPKCLGLWDEQTEAALAERLRRARALAPQTAVCLQLAHAGRKASSAVPWQGGQLLSPGQGGWSTFAPSALPHLPMEAAPLEIDTGELARICDAFVTAAGRAQRIGVDAIELHCAHGYLLHQFLSPLANQRSDAYGGSFDNRIRFPLEVFTAVRAAYDGVLGLRLSASDWVEGGWDLAQSEEFCKRLKAAGCDFVHVSSGGISPQQKIALGAGYQVPFARAIRAATGMVTTAVGLITEPHQAEAILQAEDADLIALARAFLYQPRWGWQAAAALGGTVQANPAYWRCLPRQAQAVFGQVTIGQR